MKREDIDFQSALVAMALVAVFSLMIFCAFVNTKLNTVLENQKDIDKRLTRIEQDESKDVEAIVDIYQKLNELWYDSKRVPGTAR